MTDLERSGRNERSGRGGRSGRGRHSEADPRAEDSTDRLVEVFDLVGPLYRKAQRKVEQDAPIEGLSVGVRAVLNILREHGPQTVPQMGRAQALSRQFVQRTINDAAERGLVEFAANPAHKRSSLIRLTDRGRAAITAVIDRERALLRQAGAGLTDTEIEACVRVLSQLLRFLDPVDVNRVLPDPTLPDPTLPDPTLPDPATPDPATPDPTLPDPTTPDPTTPDPTTPPGGADGPPARRHRD